MYLSSERLFCLSEDAQARGVDGRVSDCVTLIDYAGFVELTVNNEKVISWF